MEIFSQFFSHIKKLPKEYYFPLGIGLIGLLLFIYGLIQFSYKPQPRAEQTTAPENSQHYTVKNVKKIVVDIEGAVENPGLYTLHDDSRLQDGLIAAGGLSVDADRDYVAKHVNLASKLGDGVKVYIPRAGENILDGAQTAAAGVVSDQGVININTASEQDLDNLPGIGQATAEKIIAGRPYQNPQDLLTRKIVGQKVFTQIKDKITTL